MKVILNALGIIFLSLLLTLLTQVGGIIFLICLPFLLAFKTKLAKRWQRSLSRGLLLFAIYLIATLLIIPPLATRISSRVPLPLLEQNHLAPLNWIYPLANRHYVKPELKLLMEEGALYMQEKYPGTVLAYLDAGFPFIDEFPLLPHRSHDDGEKVDFCFLYKEKESGEQVHNKALTAMGYGGVEAPLQGEWDQIQHCVKKGHWQYDLLSRIAHPREDLAFDKERNRHLIRWLARERRTGKIFIEPHLKTRLGLSAYNKIRFHGCYAVRHDDHIHLQL